MLAEQGSTERLSVRQVAAAAGVTAPAVYRHFPDRRALVAEVVARCFAEFDAAVAAAVAGAGAGDPFDALRRGCHAYVRYGLDHPQLYRVMFGVWSTGPKAVGTYGRRPHPGARSFTVLVETIQQCIHSGAKVRRGGTFLAFLLWTQLHGIVDLHTGKPELPWPAPLELVDCALVNAGLGPRRASPRTAA